MGFKVSLVWTLRVLLVLAYSLPLNLSFHSHQLSGRTLHKQQNKFNGKTVTIDFGYGHKVDKDFNSIKELNVSGLILRYVDEPEPYYCLLFKGQILYPSDQIAKIEGRLTQREGQLRILTKTQKLLFAKLTSKYQNFNKSSFTIQNKTLQNQIDKFQGLLGKNANSYLPITYYSQHESRMYKKENDFLFSNKMVQTIGFRETFSKELEFGGVLSNSLNLLSRKIRIVHRGVPMLYKPLQLGEVFYWQGFTSSSTELGKAIQYKGGDNSSGVIFHIDSLNGKELGKYSIHPDEYQVLFDAFTYFVVEHKQVVEGRFSEIWLSQLSSPTTFSKDIVIWIDKFPEDDIRTFKQIESQGIQVLPLTNKKGVRLWLQEFDWVLRLKDIQTRVVYVVTEKQTLQNDKDLHSIVKIFSQKGKKPLVYLERMNDHVSEEQKKQKFPFSDHVYNITNEKGQVDTFINFFKESIKENEQ